MTDGQMTEAYLSYKLNNEPSAQVTPMSVTPMKAHRGVDFTKYALSTIIY